MHFAAIVPPWHFPVVIHLGVYAIPIHNAIDILAYAGGFQAYLWCKRRSNDQVLSFERQVWVIIGCIFGAVAGAKLLAWAERSDFAWQSVLSRAALVQGKTIVGGLLGGWMGVEVAKLCLGVKGSTGDAYVFPLLGGMAVGRVGCFLTGLDDHTHGLPSQLPWAVDFGDGVPRHPTQIYEMILLVVLGLVLWRCRKQFQVPGVLFRVFLACYLTMRLAIEFIKPRDVTHWGLSPLQWVCLAAIAVCTASIARLIRRMARDPKP
jgi:prolipoprotein diacylglyceryltransferase